MNRRFRWRLWATATLVATVPLACNGALGSSRSLAVETLVAGPRCGGSAGVPSVRWLGDRDSVAEAMARRHGVLFPGTTATRDAALAGPETAVLVELGARPSAGYAVLLDSEVAGISGGTATVEVRVERPAPGSMNAAVVTSPCLLLHVPKGPYTRVRVVDAGGVELGAVAVGP